MAQRNGFYACPCEKPTENMFPVSNGFQWYFQAPWKAKGPKNISLLGWSETGLKLV
jgi:hypothetical protein